MTVATSAMMITKRYKHMRKFLMANANSRVALTGHTDERGTREYNMALGERRAKAA